MNKKILFVVNELNFFLSHRLSIAKEASKKGYLVHLAIENKKLTKVENEHLKDFQIHNYYVSRSNLNVIFEIYTFISLFLLIKRINPQLVHLITMKPIIYGGIINRILNIKSQVISVTGMGYIFINKKKVRIKLLNFIVKNLLKFAINHKNQKIIVQNNSDLHEFLRIKKISNKNFILIPGSGVNLNLFNYVPENEKNNLIIMVCRLLKDKGVYEFIEAEKKIRNKNIKARFWLVGNIDPSNPSSLSSKDIEKIKEDSKVKFLGFRKDISRLYKYSNIAVLTSYREGFPKSLIEASACGRPIITTDVPGCRDSIINNVTGILINKKNSQQLCDAIELLLKNDTLRKKMGYQARINAENNYNINDVITKHMEIYNNLINL